MDASNLASCLAPSLLPIPEGKDQVQYVSQTIELLRRMISHHEEIFPSDGNGPVYEKFILTLPYVSLSPSLVSEDRTSSSRDGEEEDETSERSMRRSASDEGKSLADGDDHRHFLPLASQDSDYCTEDLNLLNETDVW